MVVSTSYYCCHYNEYQKGGDSKCKQLPANIQNAGNYKLRLPDKNNVCKALKTHMLGGKKHGKKEFNSYIKEKYNQ